jgi:hypothetical protein
VKPLSTLPPTRESNYFFVNGWFQTGGTGTVRINLTRFAYPINFGKRLERYETFSYRDRGA